MQSPAVIVVVEVPSPWLAPAWPVPASVRAAVTTREGSARMPDSAFGFNVGTRCGDAADAVARNRACLRDALDLPSEPCWLHQVHGVGVVKFDSPNPNPPPQAGEWDERVAPLKESLPAFTGEGTRRVDGGEPVPELQADAAVTRTPGVVLAIQTADCLPVLFAADDGAEIGAAHAGWRGLCAGVLEATLDAMQTPRGHIVAWLGPAIAAPSYEVGDEVRAAFIAHNPDAFEAFVATRAGHWSCDLYALARQRLQAAGVARIHGGGLDTFSDPRLHSYRRDGAHSGRMASLLWMTTTGS